MEQEGKTKLCCIRDTCAEIDLSQLIQNYRAVRNALPNKTRVAAVLKANAYGHGAVQVARALIASGVDMLAVACLSEALELRRQFADIDILIMGYTPDHQLGLGVQNKITLTIMSLAQAERLSETAKEQGARAKVHIKLDTGFNRLGLKPDKDTVSLITQICGLSGIEVEGIFTHLALTSKESDEKQFALFLSVVHELEQQGLHIPLKHVCDSIGMVRYPDYQLDLVRVGASLYGVRPTGENPILLETVMPLTFQTRISLIKEIEKGEGVGYDFSYMAQKCTRVGTLPVGYADGYMRCLSNIGEVSIRGKRARILGKICMDQCMVDLTDIPEAMAGDLVILLGGRNDASNASNSDGKVKSNVNDNSNSSRSRNSDQDGGTIIPIMEVADKAGTNRNEILSVISRRVPRIYLTDGVVTEVVDYVSDEIFGIKRE